MLIIFVGSGLDILVFTSMCQYKSKNIKVEVDKFSPDYLFKSHIKFYFNVCWHTIIRPLKDLCFRNNNIYDLLKALKSVKIDLRPF